MWLEFLSGRLNANAAFDIADAILPRAKVPRYGGNIRRTLSSCMCRFVDSSSDSTTEADPRASDSEDSVSVREFWVETYWAFGPDIGGMSWQSKWTEF